MTRGGLYFVDSYTADSPDWLSTKQPERAIELSFHMLLFPVLCIPCMMWFPRCSLFVLRVSSMMMPLMYSRWCRVIASHLLLGPGTTLEEAV